MSDEIVLARVPKLSDYALVCPDGGSPYLPPVGESWRGPPRCWRVDPVKRMPCGNPLMPGGRRGPNDERGPTCWRCCPTWDWCPPSMWPQSADAQMEMFYR